jgi:hypothetical protein
MKKKKKIMSLEEERRKEQREDFTFCYLYPVRKILGKR